jgi:AcrR family transcriptional regulator
MQYLLTGVAGDRRLCQGEKVVKTKGAKSSGHAEKRAALLRAFRERLIARNMAPPSLRELAAAAGVSMPTVRHYFGRREDLIVALLEDFGAEGAEHLTRTSRADGPFAASVARLADDIAFGLTVGLSEIHALGLREGLRHDRVGPAYLVDVLEPTILAIEARFKRHQEEGEMRPGDTRAAAIGLLSPIIIGHFHQRELGGSTTRHLEMPAFLRDHVAAFVRGHAGEATDAVAV